MGVQIFLNRKHIKKIIFSNFFWVIIVIYILLQKKKKMFNLCYNILKFNFLHFFKIIISDSKKKPFSTYSQCRTLNLLQYSESITIYKSFVIFDQSHEEK